MNIFLMLTMLLLAGCHPFFMFKPPSLKSMSLSVTKSSPTLKKIHIAIDQYGIPFIKADAINDAMYALGFLHARDRLFQLDVMRHAALGRTAEIFGDRGLAIDRKLRILTFRLDDQLDRLAKRDHALLDRYVQGVNDGAKHRGRTAEHFLLGINFEDFSKRDAIAIARLQSWQLASDLNSEIGRLKIAQSHWPNEAKLEVIAKTDDRGSAIISNVPDERDVDKFVMPAYLNDAVLTEKDIEEKEPLVQTGGGASNAWVIDKNFASDGHAMLMNDPHLQHNWPSNFYLATIDAPNFFATGATFVGLPGILIGSSKNLAWGVTASCLNTQDTVFLKVDEKNPHQYIFDGKKMILREWPQTYCLNKKGDCIHEMNYTSIFGPVIKDKSDAWIAKGVLLAVQWTGFKVERHGDVTHSFIDLAQAQNVDEGVKTIKSMTLPGVNFVLADTQGNIAYSYAGLVPKRDPSQNPYLPLDGRLPSSLWSEFLAPMSTPSTVKPSSGYIVTANQNIFGHQKKGALSFGQQGAPPFRALRIKERINSMIKEKHGLDFAELSSVQLDSVSIEAREFAPLLGNLCLESFKHANKQKKVFAKEIANFSGEYTTDSTGALPYEILMKEILALKFAEAIPSSVADAGTQAFHLNYALKTALLKALRGQKTAIFSTSDFSDFMSKACDRAFASTVKKAGRQLWSWRWGRHHFLQRQSLIAKAPFVGGFFKDRKREIAGVSSAPMAESGTPVISGANLRFLVKLSNPPQVFAVVDSGNSGTIGHENAFDQVKLWHEGKTITLPLDFEQAKENSVINFQLDG